MDHHHHHHHHHHPYQEHVPSPQQQQYHSMSAPQSAAMIPPTPTPAVIPNNVANFAGSLTYPLKNIPHPHPHDVLCGRGGGTNAHIGNSHWRMLVAANKELYVTLPKKQKMLLSKSIVNAVRSQQPPGRFLQKDAQSDLWYDVGDQRATEKTSQALREGAPEIRSKIKGHKSKGRSGDSKDQDESDDDDDDDDDKSSADEKKPTPKKSGSRTKTGNKKELAEKDASTPPDATISPPSVPSSTSPLSPPAVPVSVTSGNSSSASNLVSPAAAAVAATPLLVSTPSAAVMPPPTVIITTAKESAAASLPPPMPAQGAVPGRRSKKSSLSSPQQAEDVPPITNSEAKAVDRATPRNKKGAKRSHIASAGESRNRSTSTSPTPLFPIPGGYYATPEHAGAATLKAPPTASISAPQYPRNFDGLDPLPVDAMNPYAYAGAMQPPQQQQPPHAPMAFVEMPSALAQMQQQPQRQQGHFPHAQQNLSNDYLVSFMQQHQQQQQQQQQQHWSGMHPIIPQPLHAQQQQQHAANMYAAQGAHLSSAADSQPLVPPPTFDNHTELSFGSLPLDDTEQARLMANYSFGSAMSGVMTGYPGYGYPVNVKNGRDSLMQSGHRLSGKSTSTSSSSNNYINNNNSNSLPPIVPPVDGGLEPQGLSFGSLMSIGTAPKLETAGLSFGSMMSVSVHNGGNNNYHSYGNTMMGGNSHHNKHQAPYPSAVDGGLEAIGTSFGSLSLDPNDRQQMLDVLTSDDLKMDAMAHQLMRGSGSSGSSSGVPLPTAFLQQAKSRGNLLECSDSDDSDTEPDTRSRSLAAQKSVEWEKLKAALSAQQYPTSAIPATTMGGVTFTGVSRQSSNSNSNNVNPMFPPLAIYGAQSSSLSSQQQQHGAAYTAVQSTNLTSATASTSGGTPTHVHIPTSAPFLDRDFSQMSAISVSDDFYYQHDNSQVMPSSNHDGGGVGGGYGANPPNRTQAYPHGGGDVNGMPPPPAILKKNSSDEWANPFDDDDDHVAGVRSWNNHSNMAMIGRHVAAHGRRTLGDQGDDDNDDDDDEDDDDDAYQPTPVLYPPQQQQLPHQPPSHYAR